MPDRPRRRTERTDRRTARGRGERHTSRRERSRRSDEFDQPIDDPYAETARPRTRLMGQASSLYPEQFADHLEPELRDALDDCIDVSQVVAWVSDRCIETGPEQATCARLCNEVSTLGAVAAEFVARDAETLPVVLDAYLETAEIALAELEAFDDPHTEEAAMVVERSIDSVTAALERIE